jgi:hypothetical protein
MVVPEFVDVESLGLPTHAEFKNVALDNFQQFEESADPELAKQI